MNHLQHQGTASRTAVSGLTACARSGERLGAFVRLDRAYDWSMPSELSKQLPKQGNFIENSFSPVGGGV